MRILVPVAAVLAVVAAFAGPRAEVALACSCARVVPARDLATYDAAFVGRLLSHRVEHPNAPIRSSLDPAYWTFHVDRVVKGELPARLVVRTAASGASCGLELRDGDRVGLLLTSAGGAYTSGLCSQVDPDVLARFAQPRAHVVGPSGDESDDGWRWPALGLGAGAVAALSVGAVAFVRRRS